MGIKPDIGCRAVAAVWAGLMMLPLMAGAQDYPSHPVTMVMPFAAGGAADIGARKLAAGLSDHLGTQFVVENRPGAAGNIGYASVARAPADGYEVLVSYTALDTCAHALNPDLNWKTDDFEPVAMFTKSPLAFVVHPSLPVKTMPEFIAYARAHAGELNFGTPGIGSFVHIVTEMMKSDLGLEIEHVPYAGTGALMPDALAGNIQFFATGPSSILSHHKSGALRVIAVSGSTRAPELPDVPTLLEQGVSDIALDNWYGLALPKGTPKTVRDRLEGAIAALAQDQAFVASAAAAGVPLSYMPHADFSAKIAKDRETCQVAVAKAGITLE